MTDKLSLIQDQEDTPQPWYRKGLAFSCTGCGRCCTGGPGYTWLSIPEIEAMARYLNLSLDDFGKKYLRRVGQRYALLERPITHDCIFLQGKQCAVYPVRPTQCQTFPFWPGALRSPEAWRETAIGCEGIDDDAPVIPLEEIERQRQRQVKAEEDCC